MQKPCMPRLALLYLFFMLFHYSMAQEPAYYNGKDAVPLTKKFTWFADASGSVSPDSIVQLQQRNMFRAWTGGKTFNRGISNSTYWFYIPVKNISNVNKEAVLRIGNAIDSTWLYVLDSTGKPELLYAVSRYTPFDQRPFPHRLTAFPVSLDAGATKYILVKAFNKNRGIYFPMSLQSPEKILHTEKNTHWVYGIYFGIFLFIVLFNLFLYASMRDVIHLWYAGYVLAVIMFMIQEEKFYTEIFPAALLHFFENAWIPPFSLALIGCGLRVMQLFVGQTSSNSRLYWPVTVTLVASLFLSGLILLLSFFEPENTLPVLRALYIATDVLVPLSIIILIVALVEQVLQKKYLSIYYFIAVMMMVFGSAIFYLNHLGITNFNPVKPNGVVAGMACEIVILSFLLTLRYAKLKKDKELILKNQQRKLAEAIIESQESERSMLAQELHDGVSSSLTSIRLMMETYFDRAAQSPDHVEQRTKLLDYLRIVSNDVRNISHNLMPKDIEANGLAATLARLIQLLNKSNCGIHFTFISEGDIDAIGKAQQLNIYRIINELIQNIIKHSEASKANLQCLLFNSNIQLIMEDNGKGFNTNEPREGIGIKNIRTRVNYMNGSLRIDSGILGTTFLIEIPVNT